MKIGDQGFCNIIDESAEQDEYMKYEAYTTFVDELSMSTEEAMGLLDINSDQELDALLDKYDPITDEEEDEDDFDKELED